MATQVNEISFRLNAGAEQSFQVGVDARLNLSRVTGLISRRLPPLAVDLIEVCSAVYFVDRLSPRRNHTTKLSGNTWARRIDITIPVLNLHEWRGASRQLRELIEWLTDDLWSITFTNRLPDKSVTGTSALFEVADEASIPALYSGGLDSTAGVAQLRRDRKLAPVSVATNGHMLGVQRETLALLRTGSASLPHLVYEVGISAKSRIPNRHESSQRSRGLLFLGAGIASALAIGARSLLFFENGIGAINLPYLRAQIGSQATRSAHPKTIKLMERLVEKVSGSQFEIECPFIHKTKAEAISAVAAEDQEALRRSISCDTSFSSRMPGHPSCGTCTSCILRRQSVAASIYHDLDDNRSYRRALTHSTPELVAMLWQVSRLDHCLQSDNVAVELLSEFP